MTEKPRPVGRPQVAPETAESFPLRLPPKLFAELLAFKELREHDSVNSTIWEALEDWVARQREADRRAVAERAPKILAERRKKRAERRKRKLRDADG